MQIAGVKVLKAFDDERGKTEFVEPSLPVKESRTGYEEACLDSRMSNEQLAHELLIDPCFKLDDNGGNSTGDSMYEEIRGHFHDAYWKSLEDDLNLPVPCYTRVLNVLKDIGEGVSDCAMNDRKHKERTDSVLDIDLIQQQIDHNAFTWSDLTTILHSVFDKMSGMLSPQRKQEINNQWDTLKTRLEHPEGFGSEWVAALVGTLEFFLAVVNKIRVDQANARLRLIQPVINEHGIGYEMAHFERWLKSDEGNTMDVSKGWIDSALSEAVLSLDADQRVERLRELTSGEMGTRLRHLWDLHRKAMLSLITQDAALTDQNRPETLRMDTKRLVNMRDEFFFETFASSVLLLLKTYRSKPPAGKKDDLVEHVDFYLQSCRLKGESVESLVNRVIQEVKSPFWTENEAALVERAVRSAARRDHSVHKSVRKLMCLLWMKVLEKGPFKNSEVQKLLQTAKLPLDLMPLTHRIQKNANLLRRVATLNFKVHQKRYLEWISARSQFLAAQ